MSADRADVRRWACAWVGLVLSLALHVTDEALTGFVPLYNDVMASLRQSVTWFPTLTFTFEGWLSGMIAAIATLLALSPLFFNGHLWLRPLAYALSVILAANAIAHIAVSVYSGTFAPGVYSSPVMFAAAATLFVATRRAATNVATTTSPG
jgi:hypothetical protein